MLFFLLSGLWHGASWNFVIWGGLNAIFLLVVDRALFKNPSKVIKRILASLVVFSGWSLTLIFFRGQTFSEAVSMYSNLGFDGLSAIYDYGFSSIEMKFVLVLLIVMMLLELLHEKVDDIYLWFKTKHMILRWRVYVAVVFDTLGQIGTKRINKQTLELSGMGSCLQDKSRLIAKARRKHISFVIISELIKRAQKNGDQELEKYFKIASRCLNDVVISDNRLYGYYCRSRACLVCNGIRKAHMINQYLPLIKTWEEPYFVTLTIKSCYAKDLDNLMEEMKTNFKKLLERLKKRNQRGKGP